MTTMLEVHALRAAYGPKTALYDLSLAVPAGEILAVIGPNGAGKSTLIHTLSGVLPAAGGWVRVAGQDLTALPAPQRARFLAVVPQARELHARFTVWHTVTMGRTAHMGWLGRPGPADRRQVQWALAQTRTEHLAHRPLDSLSGGEQQRVLLARALAQETPLLLLDEPTAHLDLEHQARLLNLIRDLSQRNRLAVLMALHDLNLVSLYADRVALLVDGHLLALGPPAEVLTPERLSPAFNTPVRVVPHPDYGTPLVLPDGRGPQPG